MPQSLADVGTRYEHYADLLELWESTLASFDSYTTTESKTTRERKTQLEAAAMVMRKQLDVLADYDDNLYHLRQLVEGAHTNTPKEE